LTKLRTGQIFISIGVTAYISGSSVVQLTRTTPEK